MKNVLLSLVASMLLTSNLNAQDIITKRNGDDIEAKVLEVLDSEIKYKKFNFLDGPTYTEKKSEILLIRYENGSKDIFVEEPKKEESIAKNNFKPKVDNNGLPKLGELDEQFDANGIEDARMFYRGENSGSGWTGATAALITPGFGLIPAIICSSTVPKDYNLNYPDGDLMRDYKYADDYRRQAKRIKSRKVWGGYAVGSVIWLGLFLIAY